MNIVWLPLLASWTSQLLYLGKCNSSNGFVQLFECTCVGYTQIYECTVFGGGFTIWQGSAFECNQNPNLIRLRHSEYVTGAMGDCNDGAVVASSVGVSVNHYTSMLNITVEHEMINETIECVHHNIQGNTSTISQAVLRITEDPYGPPDNIHVERVESDQLVFTWNRVNKTSQCPYIRYVLTTTNCGSCPSATADTTVTCTYINASVSRSVNHTCMFAVQTEVCGLLVGERSEYLIVNLLKEYIQHGMNQSDNGRESTESDMMLQPGAEKLSTAIVTAAASISALVCIGILLLIVVSLIIFIRKQVTQPSLKTQVTLSNYHTTSNDSEVRSVTETQNVPEGIYSLLQQEDMITSGTNYQDSVVYAVIDNCERVALPVMSSCDDKVEYAEVKNQLHADSESARVPFQLLAHIGSKREVALRWYEFGRAVGVDSEILEEGSNYPPEEAIIQIFEWWSRNRTVTWKDVSEMLNNIGLQKLSSCILGNGNLSMENCEIVQQPPPLPPKPVDEMPGAFLLH